MCADDYLPTAYADETLWVTPSKVTLSGDCRGVQSHCLGVYCKIEGRECGGRPMFKHATADLVLAAGLVDGEPGWAVSRWTTFGVTEQRCMQVCARVSRGRPAHAPRASARSASRSCA